MVGVSQPPHGNTESVCATLTVNNQLRLTCCPPEYPPVNLIEIIRNLPIDLLKISDLQERKQRSQHHVKILEPVPSRTTVPACDEVGHW